MKELIQAAINNLIYKYRKPIFGKGTRSAQRDREIKLQRPSRAVASWQTDKLLQSAGAEGEKALLTPIKLANCWIL